MFLGNAEKPFWGWILTNNVRPFLNWSCLSIYIHIFKRKLCQSKWHPSETMAPMGVEVYNLQIRPYSKFSPILILQVIFNVGLY